MGITSSRGCISAPSADSICRYAPEGLRVDSSLVFSKMCEVCQSKNPYCHLQIKNKSDLIDLKSKTEHLKIHNLKPRGDLTRKAEGTLVYPSTPNRRLGSQSAKSGNKRININAVAWTATKTKAEL